MTYCSNCVALQDSDVSHTVDVELSQAADIGHSEQFAASDTKHQHPDGDTHQTGNAADESKPPHKQKALSHQQVKRLKRQKAKGGAVQPAKLQPDTAPPSTLCATCGMECNSRNKLFAHLKSTGHAAYR